MEIRDYLRALRRGWLIILLAALLGLAAAYGYLAIAPKKYEATSVVLLVANDPTTISDAQQGEQLATNAASTAAAVIDSPAVLTPVAEQLTPVTTPGQLVTMVSAAARLGTSVIDITVDASDAAQAARIANLTAKSAITVLPGVQAGTTKKPTHIRVEVIQQASTPGAPTSPNQQGVLAIGLLIGLAVGLGIAIARHALDTRLRDAEDLRNAGDATVLAVLPRLPRGQRRGLVLREHPTSRAGEAYRFLRTNIIRVEQDSSRRSLLVVPVTEGSDSAAVAINLGCSLALAGRRTIVIDLDLRRSAVGDQLGIEPGPGLADVLTRAARPNDVVHPTEQPNLYAILSGTSQTSPSDLLSSPLLPTIVSSLEGEMDFVVLHAPSLLSYTDASVAARSAGWTVVTVSAGKNTAEDLAAALDTLDNAGVEPLGVVLSGSAPGRGSRTRARAARDLAHR